MKIKHITWGLLGGLLMSIVTANANSLHDAVSQKNITEVKTLLNTDNFNTLLEERDSRGRTPLMIATQMNNPEIAVLLIEKGADVNAKDSIKDTPYLLAGAQGYDEILKATLAHGANLKDTNRYGGTAIIPAAEKGHPSTVKLLLEAGADPDFINGLGWTALLEVVILGDGSQKYVDITEILINAGADLNIKDKDGVSSLAHAKKRGFTKIVELLEKAGAK